jgi:hypothetical protein
MIAIHYCRHSVRLREKQANASAALCVGATIFQVLLECYTSAGANLGPTILVGLQRRELSRLLRLRLLPALGICGRPRTEGACAYVLQLAGVQPRRECRRRLGQHEATIGNNDTAFFGAAFVSDVTRAATARVHMEASSPRRATGNRRPCRIRLALRPTPTGRA